MLGMQVLRIHDDDDDNDDDDENHHVYHLFCGIYHHIMHYSD